MAEPKQSNGGFILKAGVAKEKWALLFFMVVGAGILGLLFHFYGYLNTWHLWNIPAYTSPFLDLRSILSAAESYAAGYDPAIANPFDPFQRNFNYPKIWYLILAAGMNQSWTFPLGIAIVGSFLAGILVFPERLDKLSVFLLMLGLFSSATLLGIERGNIDLFFFFLAAVGLVLLDHSIYGSFGVSMLGMLFKIYPVFGVGYFLQPDDRRSYKYILAGALFTLLYLLIDLKQMLLVYENTQKAGDWSYGVSAFPGYISYLVTKSVVQSRMPYFYTFASHLNNVFGQFPLLFYLPAFLVLIVFAGLGIRQHSFLRYDSLRNLRAFWLGAGIYIGSFFLGSNFDYRMIFLLFAIPQITFWIRDRNPGFVLAVPATLAALFVSLWYTVIRQVAAAADPPLLWIYPFVDQAAKWSLFAGLTYLYAASVPQWIPDDIRTLSSKLLQWFKPHKQVGRDQSLLQAIQRWAVETGGLLHCTKTLGITSERRLILFDSIPPRRKLSAGSMPGGRIMGLYEARLRQSVLRSAFEGRLK